MQLDQALAGKIVEYVMLYIHPKIGERYLAVCYFPISRTLEGDTTKIASVIKDITKQKQVENNLHQSQKMEVIGQLAGGIAHDFNNQLQGIMGYADLLFQVLEDEENRECAEMILRASQRAADLTEQLLAFARKGKESLCCRRYSQNNR